MLAVEWPRSTGLGVELQKRPEALARARDAETAHLEASLKVNGAKALRLARLRDLIVERNAGAVLDFKAEPGLEPQLWLNLSHRFTMDPDATTYRLVHMGSGRIDTLLQTENFDQAILNAEKVFAHDAVLNERERRLDPAPPKSNPAWSLTTLVYVWMTGVITGMSALALFIIIMKKLPF